jgi:hypothetical protein
LARAGQPVVLVRGELGKRINMAVEGDARHAKRHSPRVFMILSEDRYFWTVLLKWFEEKSVEKVFFFLDNRYRSVKYTWLDSNQQPSVP